MKTETNEQRHARWEREKEADQAAIQLGLAYPEARHGVCYWDKHASEAFRAGFEAGKKAQEQLAVAQQGEQPDAFIVDPRDGGDVMLISVEYEKLRGDGFRKHGWLVKPLYTHPTTQGLDVLTQAARDVVAERQRQINAKGYTADNDDGYEQGELPCAAITYAMRAAGVEPKVAAVWWPWDHDAFKTATPRRMLVKAAALLLADIEREDRAAVQAKQGGV